jgi:hypothetical protein
MSTEDNQSKAAAFNAQGTSLGVVPVREIRFMIGTVITIAWLVGTIILIVLQWDTAKTLKPNEWGDLFGGCFAPLAFLWLVLGYMQQGQELRNSADALRLQAEELRSSVEQQRLLVSVSREQVDAERSMWKQEREAREEEARPRLQLTSKPSYLTAGGGRMYVLIFLNVGPRAIAVCVDLLTKNDKAKQLYSADFIDQGSSAEAEFLLDENVPLDGYAIRVRCKSRFGHDVEQRYSVSRSLRHSDPSLLLKQIATSSPNDRSDESPQVL